MNAPQISPPSGARPQGARPEARAQRPLDRPKKTCCHDRGALSRLCRSRDQFQSTSSGARLQCAGSFVAPPLAWSVPTVRMREAQSALRLHTALAQDYAAKGPARPTLTFWVRGHTALSVHGHRLHGSSALLELGGETDAHAHLRG